MATKIESGEKGARKGAPFDPDRLAYLEVAGLRAYYDHKWMRMLSITVKLMHEQFNLSWLRAIQASYYVTRGSIAWAPLDNKPEVTRLYIHKFYDLASKYGSGYTTYDPRDVGEAEYKYWVLHRNRGMHPDSDIAPYIACLAELHSALFSITLDQAQESAVNRAHGTDAIDRVTGKRSTNIEADWKEAEDYLRKAYRAVTAQM